MRFNLSVLDQSIDLDICVSFDLPEGEVDLVKRIIRKVVASGVTPQIMAGMLVKLLADSGALVELNNSMNYDGYAVTIDCLHKSVCIQDNDDIDPDLYYDFRQHELDYVEFANIKKWSD